MYAVVAVYIIWSCVCDRHVNGC